MESLSQHPLDFKQTINQSTLVNKFIAQSVKSLRCFLDQDNETLTQTKLIEICDCVLTVCEQLTV